MKRKDVHKKEHFYNQNDEEKIIKKTDINVLLNRVRNNEKKIFKKNLFYLSLALLVLSIFGFLYTLV